MGGVPGQPIERIDRIERIILTAPDMERLHRERVDTATEPPALPPGPRSRFP